MIDYLFTEEIYNLNVNMIFSFNLKKQFQTVQYFLKFIINNEIIKTKTRKKEKKNKKTTIN